MNTINPQTYSHKEMDPNTVKNLKDTQSEMGSGCFDKAASVHKGTQHGRKASQAEV